MKQIIAILLLGLAGTAYSQVMINSDADTAITETSSESVLVEFGNDNNKGIILPYVETMPDSAVGGTLVFDVTAENEYRIKVKNQNTGWTDLSGVSGYTTTVESEVKSPQASPFADAATAKTVIGSDTSSADGILVLESETQAMVLPKVTNVDNIPSPSPGMMVFVTGTASDGSGQRLAFFNGTTWSFWKP